MKKTILLGISGGIAAYKAIQLASDLLKNNYEVEVIMSENATRFVTPLSFETIIKHKVVVDMFAPVAQYDVKHISLAQKADAFILIPATANCIAKVVHGISDDMLTTTFLAAKCKKMICPAMNTAMYENPITQANLNKAQDLGYDIIQPQSGQLACGDHGMGRLVDLNIILDHIHAHFHLNQSLANKTVLITAGPTQENLDPIRFITNHSSGKMGYALAKKALALGAKTILISGKTHLDVPTGTTYIPVRSAQEMFEACKEQFLHADIIIKTAAVADYQPLVIEPSKRKKKEDIIEVKFKKTPDILAYMGEHLQEHQVLCGFAMESEDMIASAQAKMQKKHCDLMIANNILVEDSGFQSDFNTIAIISANGVENLEKMSKDKLASIILNRLQKLLVEKEERIC